MNEIKIDITSEFEDDIFRKYICDNFCIGGVINKDIIENIESLIMYSFSYTYSGKDRRRSFGFKKQYDYFFF